ncbi:protealysin inhibitor emfourin [Streptomyces sp. NPDC001922]|uniref:protealysin inhibitor emfourin n=1 Tax=Streptomyces sp. NPDC001922 TaxID=3364624 RepID=UPI0036C5997C
MHIHVTRSGGFAGIERSAEVDTSGRADAPEWQALAEEAAAAGRDAPPAGVPDGFSYRITVDGRTFHCAEPRLSDAQRELVTRVLKEGA